ncbi:MAG: manganese efflux pump MntP family protein [bacterium]|jgi:putative Mn2+ efflux pump MntP
MSFIEILLLSIGLAMDAFAVSVTSGIAIKNLRLKHALMIALTFGGFQAVMPVIGWLAGLGLQQLLCNVDHWIAFVLLSIIGGKMIYEAFQLDDAEKADNPLKAGVLLVLGIATSIDALAVGVTFAMIKVAIITPIILIGSVTFLLCLAGVYIGDACGHFFEKKIEIFGGLVLIGIGLKILIQHLMM